MAYLLCIANNVPCVVYSSETHTWVEILPSTSELSHTNSDSKLQPIIVDVQDNLKAAKKSPLPLSIYENPQRLDDFAMCMIIIANDNDLTEDEEYQLLRHYQSQLRYSWEISKLFSLELKMDKPGVSLSMLEHDHTSFEFAIQRVMYYIEHQPDATMAMNFMNTLLDRAETLCGRCLVNADLWVLPDGGFLHIAEEFTKAFQDMDEVRTSYEKWITETCELARKYCRTVYEKYRRTVPTMGRKRRRQGKEYV